MASTTYHDSFRAFLKATNEKDVFADFVVGHLRQGTYSTMLDIGPGDGQVTKKILARSPLRYTAVEMNPQLAGVVAALIQGEMIVDAYPTDALIGKHFDVVMSLYSLPIEASVTELFVQRMIEQTAPGGLIIAVTYDTHKDDWWTLRSALKSLVDIESLRGFDEDSGETEQRNDLVSTLLKDAGDTADGVVTSHLSASTVDEFFDATGFLLSAGEEEPLRYLDAKKEVILPLLEACKKDGRYQLDMHHTYFVARKGGV